MAAPQFGSLLGLRAGKPSTIILLFSLLLFVYPAVVKDVWLPNHKAWNETLVHSLFNPQTSHEILQTPIIDANEQVVWKLGLAPR
jgi:hypothetical protein